MLRVLPLLCFFIAAASIGGAQDKSAAATAPTAVVKPTPTPVPHPEIKRWFDIDAFTLTTRYRVIETANGTAANQNNWQLQARGRFKFDREAKYTVNAGVFTGTNIISGWNSTGWGVGPAQTNVYLKQLYFAAKPVAGLEIQFGGLAVNNGVNSEITGYDNDAYITGERVVVRRPKNIYFDEVSVTYAYIGDITHPSVFSRFKRLDQSNYHQFLVRKQITKRIGVSADYTFESGRDTLRQGIRLKVPEAKVIDTFLFENYQRVSPDVAYGVGITGEKTIKKKLTMTGGFTRIDNNTVFNGDRFPRGKRLYIGGVYKISPEFSVGSVLIEGIGHLATPLTPRTRFEVILGYNFLETLHRLKIF